MKKLTVLFIIFLFLFNLSVGVFAGVFETQTEDVDINSFDVFVLDQTQKTFSNTLSCGSATNTDNGGSRAECEGLSFCRNNDSIFQTVSFYSFYKSYGGKFQKFDNTYKLHKNDLSLSGRHKPFYRRCGDSAVTEYKTKFNSYMAVALSDAGKSLFLYMNKD